MKKIRTLIIRTAGTNCDRETEYAFQLAGARPELIHINQLTHKKISLDNFHIIAIPGGFTYGDDIASGKILANELKFKIGDEVQKFIRNGKLIIGICNGFQVLVKSGLLPNLSGTFETIESTLTFNDSNKFEDRWVYLKNSGLKNKISKCVWTENLNGLIELPVAHGEGKFIPKDKNILNRLKNENLIVFKYVDSKGKESAYPHCPNGSTENIAGICDPTGRILGLMPHPERYIRKDQHPAWTKKGLKGYGDGLRIFKNGVNYAKKYL